MKLILATILFAFSFCASAQEKYQTGFLILSSERSDDAFDLFFECEIDSSKSLKENMLSVNGGTAFLALVDEDLFDEDLSFYSDTLRNQALDAKFAGPMKNVLVIPIVAELTTGGSKHFARNEKNVFLDWPVKFFNRTLFTSYNARQVSFENLRVLELAD